MKAGETCWYLSGFAVWRALVPWGQGAVSLGTWRSLWGLWWRGALAWWYKTQRDIKHEPHEASSDVVSSPSRSETWGLCQLFTDTVWPSKVTALKSILTKAEEKWVLHSSQTPNRFLPGNKQLETNNSVRVTDIYSSTFCSRQGSTC